MPAFAGHRGRDQILASLLRRAVPESTFHRVRSANRTSCGKFLWGKNPSAHVHSLVCRRKETACPSPNSFRERVLEKVGFRLRLFINPFGDTTPKGACLRIFSEVRSEKESFLSDSDMLATSNQGQFTASRSCRFCGTYVPKRICNLRSLRCCIFGHIASGTYRLRLSGRCEMTLYVVTCVVMALLTVVASVALFYMKNKQK